MPVFKLALLHKMTTSTSINGGCIPDTTPSHATDEFKSTNQQQYTAELSNFRNNGVFDVPTC
jgi:hypothetical protein